MMKADKLKSLGKYTALIGLSALLLTSCGGDNKTNSSDNLSSDNNNTGDFRTPMSGGNVGEKVNMVKSQYPCPNGSRLENIYLSLTNPTGGTQNQISGQLQQGHVNGNASTTFAGAMFGTLDLVFVSKLSRGNEVAYNFTLSFCSFQGPYGGGGFNQNTQFNNFQIVRPFVLDNDTNCPVGNLDSGEIAFSYTSEYGQQLQSAVAVRPVCN